MQCFIFVIHHKCSYRDGTLVVVAQNFNAAVSILKSATQEDTIRLHENKSDYAYLDDPLLDKDDEVLNHYPPTLTGNQEYNDIWCLYYTFGVGIIEKPGIKAESYHDG